MAHTLTASPPSTEVSAFTLATALAWLGHDCDGGCPATAMCIPAGVWFVRDSSPGRSWRQETLVVIDVGDDPARAARLRALLGEINRCTRRNHIRVCERVPADQRAPLVIRPGTPPIAGAPVYLRPVRP